MSSTPPPPARFPSETPAWALEPGCPRTGRFLLGRELGRGGMGRVDEAWDPLLNRCVAIKRLTCADPEAAARFVREANHQARVSHPAICPIHEVAADGWVPYIVMRLVRGAPLSDLRRELGFRELALLVADVAGAVEAAHRAGLVHRDLKPQNILVERAADGSLKPWVVDFGLARDLALADQTLTWAFAGTPAFMSPEQARGAAASPADDIYSLGATLYAMLAGLPPYEATTVAGLLEGQSSRRVGSIRAKCPDVPRDLETLVLRCLEWEPHRRYASAGDLEADLRRFAAGEPIRARRTTALGHLARRALRHKLMSGTVVLSLLLAGGLLAWGLRVRSQSIRQAEVATRFGLEAKGLEDLMRLERLMPPHDLRKAEARLREGMVQIRQGMAALGKPAEGPGNYALARIELVLRDYDAALGHMEAAWAAGFQSPEAAYALGTALARRFEWETRERRRRDQSREAVETVRKDLMARYGERAIACFARSRGQALDHPAFGEAQVAFILGDYRRCVEKCEEAYRALPWLSEVPQLAWHGLRGLGYVRQEDGDLPGRDRLHAQADATIREALLRAPSDIGLLACALEGVEYRAMLQSQEGHPSEALFGEGEALYRQALAIHPDDHQLLSSHALLRLRESILLTSHGKDARPLLHEAIARFAPDRGGPDAWFPGATDFQAFHLLNWTLGAAQAVWGEDPRPALAIARKGVGPGSPEAAELSLVEARFLMDRGMDPSRALATAWEDTSKALRNHYGGALYTRQLAGEVRNLQAQWERLQGRDPGPYLREGLASARESLAIQPRNAYAYWDLAQMEALEAECRAERGQPWEEALARARQAADRGMDLRGDHYRSPSIRAFVDLAEARIRLRQGGDPSAPLAAARRVLARALAADGRSYLLHLSLARVELMAGRFREAAAAAERGLRSKPDAQELWLILARARERAGAPHPEALRRAQALGPAWEQVWRSLGA